MLTQKNFSQFNAISYYPNLGFHPNTTLYFVSVVHNLPQNTCFHLRCPLYSPPSASVADLGLHRQHCHVSRSLLSFLIDASATRNHPQNALLSPPTILLSVIRICRQNALLSPPTILLSPKRTFVSADHFTLRHTHLSPVPTFTYDITFLNINI
ncbi:hypothetical protein VNO80_15400 [Phaseolus coccineus]|uniref:Uncharacterized protein n=1 Tax=Phaseolus coccineus TaxID=3886 RepID=A0AAN9R2X9_PHACN